MKLRSASDLHVKHQLKDSHAYLRHLTLACTPGPILVVVCIVFTSSERSREDGLRSIQTQALYLASSRSTGHTPRVSDLRRDSHSASKQGWRADNLDLFTPVAQCRRTRRSRQEGCLLDWTT